MRSEQIEKEGTAVFRLNDQPTRLADSNIFRIDVNTIRVTGGDLDTLSTAAGTPVFFGFAAVDGDAVPPSIAQEETYSDLQTVTEDLSSDDQ